MSMINLIIKYYHSFKTKFGEIKDINDIVKSFDGNETKSNIYFTIVSDFDIYSLNEFMDLKKI